MVYDLTKPSTSPASMSYFLTGIKKDCQNKLPTVYKNRISSFAPLFIDTYQSLKSKKVSTDNFITPVPIILRFQFFSNLFPQQQAYYYIIQHFTF